MISLKILIEIKIELAGHDFNLNTFHSWDNLLIFVIDFFFLF